VDILRTFTLERAHRLPNVPPGHKRAPDPAGARALLLTRVVVHATCASGASYEGDCAAMAISG